jgi:hypothetical protein
MSPHPSYTIYRRCDDCGADIEDPHLEGCIYLDYDDDDDEDDEE